MSHSHPLGGLYEKFHIERADGSHHKGGDHEGCFNFALDLDHDPLAREAAKVYADLAWQAGYEGLAQALWWVLRMKGMEFTSLAEQT